MPDSSADGKIFIELVYGVLTDEGGVKRVLDVGPGKGKYVSNFRRKQPVQEWIGVEIWGPYVEQYQLRTKYDRVIIADITYLDFTQLGMFDLMIFGDVLEHMEPLQAVALVQRALNFTRFLLISIPIVPTFQGEEGGNPYEKHVKDDWTHAEVMRMFGDIRLSNIDNTIGVYFLARNPDDVILLGHIRSDLSKRLRTVAEIRQRSSV